MTAITATKALAPWRASQADAMDAKAEAIDDAVQRLEIVQGIFDETATRRQEINSFIAVLRTDAENLRKEAERTRTA